MRGHDTHYKIIPYFRTPAVDIGDGMPPSHLALTMRDDQLRMLRIGALRTLCMDVWNNPSTVTEVWTLIMDGGHIISSEITPEVMKEIRKIGKFRIREREPYIVLQRLSGTGGEVVQQGRPATQKKTVCIVRYGALGDNIFALPLVQSYYERGYDVTYNTTERGESVLKGDPRISHLVVQQTNAIRPDRGEMDDYFKKWSKHFDEYVVLNGTIENQLLRVEGTKEFNDPWEKRAIECAGNYFDSQFQAAGLEPNGHRPSMWFTELEEQWAKNEADKIRKKTGRSLLVMWAMMGSSFHKMYPWTYDVWSLCEINRDDIGFVTTGDSFAGQLEDPRFKHVFPSSGKYKVRQSLALQREVDAIVTTETVTLVAGLSTQVPMVSLLSHSSLSNYHWRPGLDFPLAPSQKSCPCYPCHQLHYTRASCPRGVLESSATLCMDQIPPAEIYKVLKVLEEKKHGDNPG